MGGVSRFLNKDRTLLRALVVARTGLHACHSGCMHVTVVQRATRANFPHHARACPLTRLPPTALQPWSARRRRGERVQKAGAIGGGAALSTRGAAPGRCDDACRTYRHYVSTVEGFAVCLRGRRPLASRQSRMTAPSTAHAKRCRASAPDRSPLSSARPARLSRPRATAMEEEGGGGPRSS